MCASAVIRKTAAETRQLGANLVDSAFVTGADPSPNVRVILGGKEGPIGMMPPLGASLNDEQMASVVTYIRRAWGHTGTAVTPLEVSEVRALEPEPHRARGPRRSFSPRPGAVGAADEVRRRRRSRVEAGSRGSRPFEGLSRP